VRVWCVVPWHSRAGEVEALLRDLCELRHEGELAGGASVRLAVRVLVVDNASAERVALPPEVRDATSDAAPAVRFEALRLEHNRGGSGGFNAGISRAIEECGASDAGYVWQFMKAMLYETTPYDPANEWPED
jgi:hypothetical protein